MSTDHKPFFRPEVLQLNQRQYGAVFMNMPICYTVLTLGCGLFLGCFLIFIFCAEFSEQITVKGYLNSNLGLAQIYPRDNGVILKSYIKSGEKIQQGQPLFLIDTTFEGALKPHARAKEQQLRKRKMAIEQEIQLKNNYLNQLKPLLIKKYISSSLFQAKYDEIKSLERQKNEVEIQLIQEKESRSYVIHAPVSGTVSSLLFHKGQYTKSGKLLASILPEKSRYIAELYVPVMKAGFLKKNAQVILHYDAYPYQYFGAAKGAIQTINSTILTDVDDDKPIRIGQPYYKITAIIDKQFIQLNGKEKALQQGMTLSATVLGSKKKVWQWFLEPIYHYSGELWK